MVVLAAAGCGGGTETFSVEATRSCLADKGLNPSTDKDDLDFVAQDASEGGIYVDFGDSDVTLAFERTSADAGRTEDAYAATVEAFGYNTEGLLDRKGNVAWIWSKTPTGEEDQAIASCLRG